MVATLFLVTFAIFGLNEFGCSLASLNQQEITFAKPLAKTGVNLNRYRTPSQ